MLPEPRQILTPGVPVLTTDGRQARLMQAMLNPGHYRLVALVVRCGVFLPHTVVVPVEQVAAIADTQVRLRLSHAELAQLPTYQSVWHTHVAPTDARRALVALQYGAHGISERIIEVSSSAALASAERQGRLTNGLIALRAGLPIWSGTQRVGRLERLLLDSKGRVRQIIVRTSRMFGRRVLVSIEQVAHCDAEGVWLALERTAFERLPDYGQVAQSRST